MKKFVAMLCVAGLLTGCAVSGEKKTDEVKPEAPWRRPRKRKKRQRKPEEKDGDPAAGGSENEGDEQVMPENFRELFAIEAEGIDYLSVEGIEVPEGTAISMIGKDSASGFWKRVKAGAEQAVTDINEALGYTGNAKVKLTLRCSFQGECIRADRHH